MGRVQERGPDYAGQSLQAAVCLQDLSKNHSHRRSNAKGLPPGRTSKTLSNAICRGAGGMSRHTATTADFMCLLSRSNRHTLGLVAVLIDPKTPQNRFVWRCGAYWAPTLSARM